MHPDSPADRAALRRALIGRREALPTAEHAQLSAAVRAHLAGLLTRLAPTCLGFCWPYRAEADLLPLLHDWLTADATRHAALPVVETTQAPLRFRRWTPDTPLAPDRYGIPTPTMGEWVQPDLLLIPVNGFDTRGFRLGYGGGYFDRSLAAARPALGCVGVGFELARMDWLPAEAHDQPLDWIVTEKGVFHAESRPEVQR